MNARHRRKTRTHGAAVLLLALSCAIGGPLKAAFAADAAQPRLVGDLQLSTFVGVLDFAPSGERFSCRLHPAQVPYPQSGDEADIAAWKEAQDAENRNPEWMAVYPTASGLVSKEFKGLYGSWHMNDVLYYVDLPQPLALAPIVEAPDVLDVRPMGMAALLGPALRAVARAAWVYAETGNAPVTDLTSMGLDKVEALAVYSQATTSALGDYVPGPEPVVQGALRQMLAAANVYFTTESGAKVYPGPYGFNAIQEPILARLPGGEEVEPIAIPGVEGAWSFAFDVATGRALVESFDRKSFAVYRVGAGPEGVLPAFDEDTLDEYEYQLLPGHDTLIATRTSMVDCPPLTAGPYVELRGLDGSLRASLSTDIEDATDRPHLYKIYASPKLIILWLGRPVGEKFKHLLRVYALN